MKRNKAMELTPHLLVLLLLGGGAAAAAAAKDVTMQVDTSHAEYTFNSTYVAGAARAAGAKWLASAYAFLDGLSAEDLKSRYLGVLDDALEEGTQSTQSLNKAPSLTINSTEMPLMRLIGG